MVANYKTSSSYSRTFLDKSVPNANGYVTMLPSMIPKQAKIGKMLHVSTLEHFIMELSCLSVDIASHRGNFTPPDVFTYIYISIYTNIYIFILLLLLTMCLTWSEFQIHKKTLIQVLLYIC